MTMISILLPYMSDKVIIKSDTVKLLFKQKKTFFRAKYMTTTSKFSNLGALNKIQFKSFPLSVITYMRI